MGLIESTFPGGRYRLIDPCSRCGRAEGIFSVPWPDIPQDELFLLCDPCMWRKFNEMPKGSIRRKLVKRVFERRVFGTRSGRCV